MREYLVLIIWSAAQKHSFSLTLNNTFKSARHNGWLARLRLEAIVTGKVLFQTLCVIVERKIALVYYIKQGQVIINLVWISLLETMNGTIS